MNTDAKNIELAAQLMHDQAFRRKVRNKDPDTLAKLGVESSDDAPELKVVSSTRDKTYFSFPLLPDNHRISGAELGQIQAAGSASTVATIGTAATLSSTLTTASSIGTAGSAG